MSRTNIIRSLILAAGLGISAVSLAGCETAAMLMLNSVELTQLAPMGDTLYVASELNSKTFKQMKRTIEANPQVKT